MITPDLTRSGAPLRGAAVALLLFIAAMCGGVRLAAAQSPSAACDYRSCALAIVPAWNGLAVVQGESGRRVANLNFFLPRDITPALRGDPSAPGADAAALHARRAVRVRRIAALLTDVGAVAVGLALARNRFDGADDGLQTALAIGGTTALVVSVPLQFAADGALSRAAWWHNLRYAP